MKMTANDVIDAFHVMLGRPPESTDAIDGHLSIAKTPSELVKLIAGSEEFEARIGGAAGQRSPFFHFNSCLDVPGIVRAHARPDRKAVPGYLVNFLDVKIPTRVMPVLHDRGGRLDHLPLPANFHADMAEWAAALRAVDLSGPTFTVIELGCGWGCWMTNTGVAARAVGKQLDLIGVEGDPLHIEYARETFDANQIDASQYTLHRGIAAAEDGHALFPRRTGDENNWGYAARFGVSKDESDAAVASGLFDSLPMVPIEEVIGARRRIDLLHMDIQGGEADLVANALALLNDRVAYLVVGTHSRSLEGRLIDTLLGAGWHLEIERPAIFQVGAQLTTTIDGVQGWRNPRFLP